LVAAELPERRFPPPWIVEETPACFIVRDGNEQTLAYVYCEDEPGRRSAAKLLTKDEARRVAANIAQAAGPSPARYCGQLQSYQYQPLLHCMSPLLADTVAKRFLTSERRTLFPNWREWGILIQESGCLDSIIAHFCPSGRWAATFATVSAQSGHDQKKVGGQISQLLVRSLRAPLFAAGRPPHGVGGWGIRDH
jgi:hypothetical protein